jgi:hypothetical protein
MMLPRKPDASTYCPFDVVHRWSTLLVARSPEATPVARSTTRQLFWIATTACVPVGFIVTGPHRSAVVEIDELIARAGMSTTESFRVAPVCVTTPLVPAALTATERGWSGDVIELTTPVERSAIRILSLK